MPKNNSQQVIEQLFEAQFVMELIKKHAPHFAAKHDLADLAADPIKNNIGDGFYHVVVRYSAKSFADMPIYCSAHLKENRKNAFDALTFITKHGFKNSKIFIPRPLFFEPNLKAFFYQGVEGENLLSYIKKQGFDLSEYLDQAASWIAQLHNIDAAVAQNFNQENSRIKTILPGPDYFLAKIKRKFPTFYEPVKTQFDALVQFEEKSLPSLPKQYLIHGDLHPENVIINKTDGKISMIDFTDVCLADWARDIGSFLQQLAFMSSGFRSTNEIDAIQTSFLENYQKHSKVKIDDSAKKRIRMYQAWTALRSAVYFLTKLPAEPKEAKTELSSVAILMKTV